MTSATLYREGADLDELLADLDAEHPGRVRVVEVSYGRDGGVLGFFARRMVGVHYTLDGSAAVTAPVTEPIVETSPLDALLRAAEAAEMVESGRAPVAPAPASPEENVEFARMLLDLATEKAAARRAAQAEQPARFEQPAPFEQPPFVERPQLVEPRLVPALVPAAPAPEPEPEPELAPAAERDLSELAARVRRRPIGAHRAADEQEASAAEPAWADAAPSVPSAARTPLTLRRQLAEIGVPVSWVPGDDANAYQVVERLVRRLVIPDEFEPEPGQILAVVGPAALALAEAERVCARFRLDPDRITTAGCGASGLTHRRQAASLAAQVRADADEPCVVVVATDGADPTGLVDREWAASVLAALAPDHVLAVVDGGAKPADLRAQFAALGGVTAVALVGAARTASPAALWQLDAPVVALDGRRATRGAWAALLIDRLADLDGA